MKLKKLTALLLAGVMTASLAACGGSSDAPASNDTVTDNTQAEADTNADAAADADAEADAAADAETEAPADLSGSLTIWSFTEDFTTKAEKFMEKYPNVTVENVIYPTGEYPDKVDAALGAGDDSIDIFVGEPQMLPPFMQAGYFEDLDQAPYNFEDYADQLYEYVTLVGKDADGVQRAVGYQTSPAGFYYRRSIANKVFGTDDPEVIGEKFSSYANIIAAAEELKAAGYRIFASDSELSYFTGQVAWVENDTLQLSNTRLEYMDLVVKLFQDDLTAYASTWTTPWYQAMAGEVAVLSEATRWGVWEEDENGNKLDTIWGGSSDEAKEAYNEQVVNFSSETTEVFAFGLPAWGTLTMASNAAETLGDWAVCAGPEYGFGGGTWVGISSQSKNKELAWEFVKFATIDEEHADWWISEKYPGDCVSNIAVMERHYDDEIEYLGGQKVYPFWAKQIEGIDYSKVTEYDKAIGDFWGSAITKVKNGECSKEQAIEEFYDEVAATYPDLTINR